MCVCANLPAKAMRVPGPRMAASLVRGCGRHRVEQLWAARGRGPQLPRGRRPGATQMVMHKVWWCARAQPALQTPAKLTEWMRPGQHAAPGWTAVGRYGLSSYSLRGSNPRPMAHKTIALTTELREHLTPVCVCVCLELPAKALRVL